MSLNRNGSEICGAFAINIFVRAIVKQHKVILDDVIPNNNRQVSSTPEHLPNVALIKSLFSMSLVNQAGSVSEILTRRHFFFCINSNVFI